MPSISRPAKASYLLQTIHSLINNTSDRDKNISYIVIFLADLDEAPKSAKAGELTRTFGKYIDRGFMIVIEAYPEYYPPLTYVKERFGDPDLSRKFWRSKQNVDTSFVMCYCKDLSQYYLHLEDDVRSSPSFVPKLQDFITRERDKFLVLEVAVKGNAAKAYHSRDLENAASFFYLMYDEMPMNWLMERLRKIKLPRRMARKFPMASLFHVGHTSSLEINLNSPRDKGSGEAIFDQYDQKYKGLNPPAIVTSSFPAHQGTPQDAYEKGSGYFWGKPPRQGDYVLIKFNTATTVEKVFVDTGCYGATGDLLYGGVLQASFETSADGPQLKTDSCSNFRNASSFSKGKVKAFIEKTKKVNCLRILVTQNQEAHLFLREIDVWPA